MLKNKIKEIADTRNYRGPCYTSLYQEEFEGIKYYPPKINYARLPHIHFDVYQALDEYNKIKEKYGLMPYPYKNNRQRYYYRAISLTSHIKSKNDLAGSFSIYDEDNQIVTYENYVGQQNLEGQVITLKSDCSKDYYITKACSSFFESILKSFSTPYTKVRLIELLPGGVIPPHIDYPFMKGIKLHAFLDTNEDVYYDINGETFKTPSDGHFYWLDISKPHSIVNTGKTSRISLCVNLSPYENSRFRGEQIEDIINLL